MFVTTRHVTERNVLMRTALAISIRECVQVPGGGGRRRARSLLPPPRARAAVRAIQICVSERGIVAVLPPYAFPYIVRMSIYAFPYLQVLHVPAAGRGYGHGAVRRVRGVVPRGVRGASCARVRLAGRVGASSLGGVREGVGCARICDAANAPVLPRILMFAFAVDFTCWERASRLLCVRALSGIRYFRYPGPTGRNRRGASGRRLVVWRLRGARRPVDGRD